MRKGAPLLDVSPTTRDGLQNVEMVKNIIQGAVVWKSVEKISDGSLRLHQIPSG